MRTFLLLCLCACVLALVGRNGLQEGDFDVYVLEQVWANNFCCANQEFTQECSSIQEDSISSNHLTLYSFRPTFQSSRKISYQYYQWPQYCDDFIECTKFEYDEKLCTVYSYFLDLMKPYWKESNAFAYLSDNSALANREWARHGSCSGLPQYDYFETSLETSNRLPTPDLITNNVGKTVRTEELREQFGTPGVILKCDNRGHLQAVDSCWEKLPDYLVGNRAECPSFLQDTCQFEEITITKYSDCPVKVQPSTTPECATDELCNTYGFFRCYNNHCTNSTVHEEL